MIGWVIVGGLMLGTLLTIFVVPTVYTLLARRRVPAPQGSYVATVQAIVDLVEGLEAEP